MCWRPTAVDADGVPLRPFAPGRVSSGASGPALGGAGDVVVDVDDTGRDQRPAVPAAAVLVGAVAALLPLGCVGSGSQERLRECVLVVGRDEPAGSCGDELGGS